MLELLGSPAELRDAAAGDPLVTHLVTRWVPEPKSGRLGAAVGVWSNFWGVPELTIVGDPVDAARLLDALLPAMPDGSEVSVPRATPPLLPSGFPLAQAFTWAFRWTDAAPPGVPDTGAEWLPAEAVAEVAALLDAGFPDASMRPGDPHVRRWAGLRDPAGRLVGCAADATGDDTLGFLASITSDPGLRGRGHGFAVSAYATAELLDRHGRVGLWHMGANTGAERVYDALGYRRDHPMAVLAPPGAPLPPGAVAQHAG